MSTQTIFLTAGGTSKSVDLALIQNSSAATPGDPITGLAFNTASLTAYYRKGATGTLTAITLATQTVGGAYSSGGFVQISSSNAPGQYRFDIPNTVIDTSGEANITFTGATDLATHTLKIIVTAIDFYDTVRAGLTSLPNVVSGSAGALITSGTGTSQLSVTSGGINVIGANVVNASSLAADAVTEIQSGLATQASVNTIDDFLDTEVAAILAAVDTEVVSILALLDDPRAEPGQGAPPVNPDLATKVDYLYKFLRNRSTQTATELSIYADNGTTVDHKATVSDNGTTFDRTEFVSGP